MKAIIDTIIRQIKDVIAEVQQLKASLDDDWVNLDGDNTLIPTSSKKP